MTYVGDGEVTTAISRGEAAGSLTLGPMTARTLASGELTGGRYSLYAIRLGEEGGGAGEHFHRLFAESFQVLRGAVEFYDGRDWTVGTADDHVFIPQGGIHAFRNVSGEVAEMLMMSTPAAPREDYFRELLEIARDGIQMSPEEFAAFWARHDTYAP